MFDFENLTTIDYTSLFEMTQQSFPENPFMIDCDAGNAGASANSQINYLAQKNNVSNDDDLSFDESFNFLCSPTPTSVEPTSTHEVFAQMQRQIQQQQVELQYKVHNKAQTHQPINIKHSPTPQTQHAMPYSPQPKFTTNFSQRVNYPHANLAPQQQPTHVQYSSPQPPPSHPVVIKTQPVHVFDNINNNNNNNTHVFERQPYSPPANLIRLVEGFNTPVKEKQLGGKDNSKHALPRQVVELAYSKLPPNSDPEALTVRASVLGYDRMARTRAILGMLSEKRFIEMCDPSQQHSRWLASFDDLVVQYSSHNNGQKLSVRFQLLDANMKPVCFVDSHEFETITKRGLEKIKERQQQKRKRGQDDEDSNSEIQAFVQRVDPGMGPTQGGQLVKIRGRGFISAPNSQTVVKFGDKNAREVHSIRRNQIVCETPEGDRGLVDVNVSIGDKKNAYLPSYAQYRYVDANDQEAVQLLVNNIFNSNQQQQQQQH
ncbi:ankyrin repeat-containing protein with IPT/TIG domain, partial [Acrasis kona]